MIQYSILIKQIQSMYALVIGKKVLIVALISVTKPCCTHISIMYTKNCILKAFTNYLHFTRDLSRSLKLKQLEYIFKHNIGYIKYI